MTPKPSAKRVAQQKACLATGFLYASSDQCMTAVKLKAMIISNAATVVLNDSFKSVLTRPLL